MEACNYGPQIRLYDTECAKVLQEAATINNSIMGQLLEAAVPGVTTLELEALAESLIVLHKCEPLFKGYEGFPFCACFSVNECIVHGLANSRPLLDGDVLSIDLGVRYRKLCSDMARTKIVGRGSDYEDLLSVSEQAFFAALPYCNPGNTTGDLGAAILTTIAKNYKIFEKFQGHGIGIDLHEDPAIPNFGVFNRGTPLKEGMCICIEPVVLHKTSNVIRKLDSIYNIVQYYADDGLPASHYENQVFITSDGPRILTL